MRGIVTGVAGFIGSHVAHCLVDQGWQVLGIDDLSGGFRQNVPQSVDFQQLDCGENLDVLFESFHPDTVFHLAAYAAEGLSHHVPLFNYQNNVLATVNVMAAAQRAKARHFVFTSSIAAYGHSERGRPFDESDHCSPCDPYGIAKLACEQHIRAAHDYFGGPTYTIFRPHNVYGPAQNVSDPYRNVVGIFMRRVLEGLPLPIFGDGSQTRSFSYIAPVAAAIAASPSIAGARNEVFNVGGDVPTSVHELARLVSHVLKSPLNIQHLPPRNEVQHAHANHAKCNEVFAEVMGEAIDLEAGLTRMAEYVTQHPIPDPTPCPAPIELSDRLPPSWK